MLNILTLPVSTFVLRGLAHMSGYKVLSHGTSIDGYLGILAHGADPSRDFFPSFTEEKKWNKYFYVMNDGLDRFSFLQFLFCHYYATEGALKKMGLLGVTQVAMPLLRFVYHRDEVYQAFDLDTRHNDALRTSKPISSDRVGLIGLARRVKASDFTATWREDRATFIQGIFELFGGVALTSVKLKMGLRYVKVISGIVLATTVTAIVINKVCPRLFNRLLGVVDYPSDTSHPYLNDLIQRAPELQTSYELLTGTWEKYTVYEHTQLVLGRLHKYQNEVRSRLKGVPLSFEQFTLFLALHDIGKGESKLPKNQHKGKDEKERESICTVERIESVALSLGISQRLLKIFRALLKYDSIGEYLKSQKREVCKERLEEAALEAEVDYGAFTTLMDLYHNCDAGAYKNLALRIFIHGTFARVPHHEQLIKNLCLS